MIFEIFGIADEDDSWRDLLLIYTEDSALTVGIKAISSNGDITFAELKQLLQTRFCGPDYKRAFELKLRNLRFEKGSKIAPFVHDLRSTTQVLYGLENEDNAG